MARSVLGFRPYPMPHLNSNLKIAHTFSFTGVNAVGRGWRMSDRVCGLCDQERHLAHIVKLGGRWFAFDATHSSAEGNGFLFLGSFAGRAAAMNAAESGSRLRLVPVIAPQ